MTKFFRLVFATNLAAMVAASGATMGDVYSNKSGAKVQDVYGSGSSLLVGNKPYESLANAKAAMNALAKQKYGELYPGATLADAQQQSELAGYIVSRKNLDGTESFYITGLQKLGGRGGDRGPLGGYRLGDSIYGYHTGRHTEGQLTIPSSKDYKNLRSSSEKKWANWEMEIVDDMATGKSAAIDKSGGVWSFSDNGTLKNESDSVADYCNKKSGEFKDGYELTKAVLANPDENDPNGHAAACVKDADSLVVNGTSSLGAVDQTSTPSSQSYTIENTAMKQYMAQQLESAYSTASAMAAEAGVGAEYQAAVAPVVSQGRAAISAIPDRQTVTVPAGSAQGGGYSSETMDRLGKTFAEQGSCAAGLQLEALKNQK